MYNDSNRPLVFIGSNSNIYKLVELAASANVPVLGIVDDDFHGQGHYKNIPVIAQEQDLASLVGCQFICATNWTPDNTSARNRIKRARQLELIQKLNLPLATLISPLASVSAYSKIGAGTAVYAYATIEPQVTVGAHSIVYDYAIVGHESTVGNNVVLQRQVLVTSLITVEDNVYFGLGSRACRSHTTVAQGTFVHPHIMLLRGTQSGEVVSLAGRKTYGEVVVQ